MQAIKPQSYNERGKTCFQAIAGMQPGVVWPQGLVAAPGMLNGAMMAPMAQHVMPGSKSSPPHGLTREVFPGLRPRVKFYSTLSGTLNRLLNCLKRLESSTNETYRGWQKPARLTRWPFLVLTGSYLYVNFKCGFHGQRLTPKHITTYV